MNHALCIYYVIVFAVLSFIVGAGLPLKIEEKARYSTDEERDIALKKEEGWLKAIATYTPLLLSGCVAYYYFRESIHTDISIAVFVVASTALVNMFFSVGCWLSEYFGISYEMGMQSRNFIHRWLYCINKIIAVMWHLIPFLGIVVQAIAIGHIFTKLAFC